MDKTLLRPMFKKRYLETKRKHIKTFAKGGITSIPKFQEGGLTNQQKAVIAATFAASFNPSVAPLPKASITFCVSRWLWVFIIFLGLDFSVSG